MDPDYHLILDTLADAVVVGDRAGRITYANPAAERLLNWDRGALTGQPLTAIIPAHLRTRHTAGFNRYRSTWAPRVLGKGIRVAALRKGGSEVRIELTLTAYRGRGGEELYLASLRPLARHNPEEDRPPAGAVAPQDSAPLPLALFQESPAPEQLARKLVELLARRFHASLVQLWLHDREAAVLRLVRPSIEPVPVSRKPVQLPLEGDPSPLAEAARTLKAVALASGGSAEGPLAGVEAGIVVPLHQAGELFGVLAFGCDPPLPETTVRTLETLALLIAGSLQALRLRELQAEHEAWVAHVELLRRLARAPLEGREPRIVLQEALQSAAEIGGFDGGLVLHAEGEGWRVEAGWGYRPPLEGVLLPPFPDLDPLRDGETLIRLDETALRRGFPALRQRGVKALIAAPIRTRSGATGVVLLETRQVGRQFSRHDEVVVQSLAEQTARL